MIEDSACDYAVDRLRAVWNRKLQLLRFPPPTPTIQNSTA
jgi:hypothetical protein